MPYDEIESSEIETGDPVTAGLWTKVKDSLDDHEERVSDLEAANANQEPIEWIVKGAFASFGSSTGVIYKRVFQNFTISAARLFVVDAGSSGTLEIDVLYKRGGGAWTSIFSTKPSVAFGAGDLAVSSNAVISTADIQAGDVLRLDIVSCQTGNEEFHLYMPKTVTA